MGKISSLTMKVMGLIALTLAVCLVSASAQPIFLIDPISTATFTTAGGLALTAASGAGLTIPTSTLVLGKVAAAKALLLKAYLASREPLNKLRSNLFCYHPFSL